MHMRKLLTLLTVLMLGIFTAHAQSRTITGRVSDSANRPIDGASVMVKGTSRGTTSASDGTFKLNVTGNPTLTVSALGFGSINVPVGAQSSITVTLSSSSATSLSEVVVTTALGIQRQARSLGYSTAKIGNKDLVQAKPVSVANGLTGKVSGLQINTVNNGLFAPTRITLRGARSLTGNNQPLIVVDGAIYYSDISTLNPEDIADITILKGSSASAVYGSDASNGVIVVTSKKGSRNRSALTYTSTVQLETVSYLPAYQSEYGSNGGENAVVDQNDLSSYVPYENQSYGPKYNGIMVPLGRPVSDGSVFMVPYAAVKNQKRDFFNTGVTTQQNLSFQSGGDNGSFFLSAQDIIQKNVMPEDQGRRDIFRIGGTQKYSIFSANYSVAYTYKYTNTTNTNGVLNNLYETPSMVPIADLSDIVNNKYADPNGYYNDYYYSPWEVIKTQRNLTTEHDVNANLSLSLQPFKWLNLTYRSSVNFITTRYEYKSGEINYSNYAKTYDSAYFSNYDGTAIVPSFQGAKYIASSNTPATYGTNNFNNFLYNSDLFASVNTSFARDFTVNGTVGMSYIDNKVNYSTINNSPLNFEVYNTSSFQGTPSVTGGFNNEARKLGIFGEAQVGYKSLLFVHGSYRTDIDSRLSKDNRWIPYYDIDGAVVLSDLFKSVYNNKVINYGKLRYAHSVTGNISALSGGSQYIAYGAYATVATLSSASGFPLDVPGYSLNTTIANPTIKPEKVQEDEIGLDLGFLKDRLTLGASVYKSRTEDGIVYAQLTRATGFTSALINAAKLQNKGVELDIHFDVIQAKNTRWNVGVNWTHNESKVLGINQNVSQLALLQYGGGAGGGAYAVVNQAYPVIEAYDWNRDSATGKVIVNAKSGLPTRSTTPTVLGQANPKDILGFTTSFTWKAFSFSATADFRGGHKIFNIVGETIDHAGMGEATVSAGRTQFIFPNSVVSDGKGGYVENTSVSTSAGNFNFWPNLYNSVGANYVVSAAAWKLREVVLTYTIPASVLDRTKFVKGASFSLTGRNLLMLRPKSNQWTDPEFSDTQGNGTGTTSLSQAPPTRIYGATLSVTF